MIASVGALAVSALALCGPGAAGSLPALEAPAYYAIDLVPTGRVPGTRGGAGVAGVTFQRGPFPIAVAPDGSFVQRLRIEVRGIPPRTDDVLAVWLTTHELDEVKLVGTLTGSGVLEGESSWNKFLVVVSAEESLAAVGERWQGPIVMRGMSRSGRMHTMAGHGPFQGEPCAKYGY